MVGKTCHFLFPFPFDIGTERSPFSKCVQALFVHMVNGFNPNFSSIRTILFSSLNLSLCFRFV
jgi:hypothetical protein